jgi:hypothetical protein
MSHSPEHAAARSRVILLGDNDTVRHRDELSDDAARQNCVIAEVFSFPPGEPCTNEELTEVDAVTSALGRAIAARMDIWVPFLGPDLCREQHWRRLSLVLQRHGLNLRAGRELNEFPRTGGFSDIDFALRREVQAVDELDRAALASVGAETLGREIERALVVAAAPAAGARGATAAGQGASAPSLPAPTVPWSQRQPMLKRYVCWLVRGCGVTQAATARVLNSMGQRTPKGHHWQPGTVSKLLNGRYDGDTAALR